MNFMMNPNKTKYYAYRRQCRAEKKPLVVTFKYSKYYKVMYDLFALEDGRREFSLTPDGFEAMKELFVDKKYRANESWLSTRFGARVGLTEEDASDFAGRVYEVCINNLEEIDLWEMNNPSNCIKTGESA